MRAQFYTGAKRTRVCFLIILLREILWKTLVKEIICIRFGKEPQISVLILLIYFKEEDL